MSAEEVSTDVDASAEAVFDLLHDYDRRLHWDPFLREARIIDGAARADVGVTTRCVARWGVGGRAMDTVYVTFRRPDVAAVKMTSGPWFLRDWAASLRQVDVGGGVTRVTYRWNFTTRPSAIAPVVGAVFRHETTRRLAALREFLAR